MSEWIQAVSKRAGVDPNHAESVLNRYRVYPTPSLPRPRKLLVERIRFSGVKLIEGHTEEFDFNFKMGPGVWCVATDQENLAGKSSVLQIILWSLRGRCHVQRDVRDWLRNVELHGRIDDEVFVVRFEVTEGLPNGTVSISVPQERMIARFSGVKEFEQVMDDFMLSRLGLLPTPFWQKRPGDEDGDATDLSWPGYSQALFIPSGSHRAVLGDEIMGGQAGKLLQVFVGLPWAHTQAVARVSLQQRRQHVRNLERRRVDENRARAAELKAAQDRLDAVKRNLAGLADESRLFEQLDRALVVVQTSAAGVAEHHLQVENARRSLRELTVALREDQQRLLDVRESDLARRFFNGLQPKICPRCDHDVDDERRHRESEQGVCSLCGIEHTESDVGEDVLTEAEARVSASESAERDARADVETAVRKLNEAQAAYEDARRVANRLMDQRETYRQRRELELEAARLEGMLGESSQPSLPVSEAPGDSDLPVLEAAEQEAMRRRDESKAQFFNELNDEVLRLARSFGMTLLERVELDAGARMKLVKGGSQTWFSDVSDGERLRLKIALVIALLRLGERNGIGRHPGLLLIDSPGAQEEADRDFTTEIEELNRVAAEMSHIQLVLSSARASQVQKVLPVERIRLATPGGKLW